MSCYTGSLILVFKWGQQGLPVYPFILAGIKDNKAGWLVTLMPLAMATVSLLLVFLRISEAFFGWHWGEGKLTR